MPLKEKKTDIGSLIVAIVILVAIGAFAGWTMKPQVTQVVFEEIPEANAVSIILPAVNNGERGVTADLEVELIPGSGRVLTDIESLLFWADTQQSMQIAKKVAEDYTKTDLSNFDLIYRISAENVTVIEGGSAGAALALATIAVIENKDIPSYVSMTGAIDERGNILAVGGVKEKARAVKERGVTKFMVPAGQSRTDSVIPDKTCESIRQKEVCEIVYRNLKLEDFGLEVIEVKTIRDAVEVLA